MRAVIMVIRPTVVMPASDTD
jgi:hypothetical protein